MPGDEFGTEESRPETRNISGATNALGLAPERTADQGHNTKKVMRDQARRKVRNSTTDDECEERFHVARPSSRSLAVDLLRG